MHKATKEQNIRFVEKAGHPLSEVLSIFYEFKAFAATYRRFTLAGSLPHTPVGWLKQNIFLVQGLMEKRLVRQERQVSN